MKITQEYNYEKLLPLVLETVKAGRPPFIWGPPGIGKSSLGREVAEKLNAELYILDAPLLQPLDYCVAVPDHSTRTVQLYPTGFLPKEGPAVVLVEDLPHAKPYQMVPLMQMVLDRRIGPVKFADNVYFIITGNREEDLAMTNPIPSPLLNRTVHFDMKADVEQWIKWAKANELDERIYSFVNANPQHFLAMPEEGVRAWPTPRSWHMLSDIIKGKPDNEVYPYALACVGATANVFVAWLKYLKEVNIDDIIQKGIIPNIDNREKHFAIAQAVAHKVNHKVLSNPTYRENVVKYWKSLPGDFQIMFLKELIVYKRNKVDTSVLEKFAQYVPEVLEKVREVFDA